MAKPKPDIQDFVKKIMAYVHDTSIARDKAALVMEIRKLRLGSKDWDKTIEEILADIDKIDKFHSSVII